MPQTITQTNFHFPGQTGFYRGKVRDVYYFGDKLIMVTSDRISAFDHILPRAIPEKGKILNSVATSFLTSVKDIVPTWLEASPHPSVSIGKRCKPIKIEMVVRGYLAGHAWRVYNSGVRTICGVTMPDGMKESQAFPEPIITPATKAEEGHDEDISYEDIIVQNITTEAILDKLYQYSKDLFTRGTEHAAQHGLILVDTKYEFGYCDGQIYLMDEIHTPDSSRYYIADGYQERLAAGETQRQLSKEFVREWLMDNNFQGLEGQTMPEMPDAFVETVTNRYKELYSKLMGSPTPPDSSDDLLWDVEKSILDYLYQY